MKRRARRRRSAAALLPRLPNWKMEVVATKPERERERERSAAASARKASRLLRASFLRSGGTTQSQDSRAASVGRGSEDLGEGSGSLQLKIRWRLSDLKLRVGQPLFRTPPPAAAAGKKE